MKVPLIILTAFCCSGALAQDSSKTRSLYFEAFGGYALPVSPTVIAASVHQDTSTYTADNVNGSYGKGLSFGATVGFALNKHLSLEASVSQLLSSNYKSDDYLIYGSGGPPSQPKYTYNRTWQAKTLRAIYSVRGTLALHRSNVYAKLGMITAFKTSIDETIDYTVEYKYPQFSSYTGGAGQSVVHYFSDSKKPSLGFLASAGVNREVNKRFSFYLEVSLISQSYGPDKSEVTKNEFGGTGTTFGIYPVGTTNYYVDSFDSSNSGSGNYFHKKYYSFSSIGLNGGVRINIISFK